VGRVRGDQVVAEGVIPDDHESIGRRGKTARFEFTIREIKRLELAALDAEFFASQGFDDEQDMRDAIRRWMEANIEDVVFQGMRGQVADYLVDRTAMEIPERLSQRQLLRATMRKMIDLYEQNTPEADIQQILDEWRLSAQRQIARDLKLYFILEKIAEERNIDVMEEELNAMISQIAHQSGKRFDRVRDELTRGDGLMNMVVHLRDRKVLDSLLADAEIAEAEVPKPPDEGGLPADAEIPRESE
jgi:trigger factor